MAAFVNFVEDQIHKNFDTTYDSDTTDRLKYVYSIWLLCAGAVLFFASTYVGQPLQCWAPNQFSDYWEEYAESYCFVENTYFVPENVTNLPKETLRYEHALRWYQWVPVILALEALLLYSPRFIWKGLQRWMKISISIVTVEARNNAKKEHNTMTIKATHARIMGITSKVRTEDEPPKRRSAIKDWAQGRRLTMSLLFTKMISIAVIIMQIFTLDWIIFGNVFYPYGFSVLVDVFRGKMWQESGSFPRVTYCDFEVRELGQVHKWSLQCVLMVNMYNEKVFVFIWWWLIVLLIVSIFNLAKWILRVLGGNQDICVERVIKCFTPTHWNEVPRFRREVLKTDGVTLLRLIEENATIYQAADYIKPMWEKFINDKDE